jgi:outer membrane protein TolC
MQEIFRIPVYLVLFSGSLVLLSACQTYAPESVDLGVYRLDWEERSINLEPTEQWVEGVKEAHSSEVKDGLSFNEGQLLLLQYNPELRVARAEAGIAEAHNENAGRWADPVLDLVVGRKTAESEEAIGSSTNATRLVENDMLVLGAGMGITIPLSGRPAVERALAAAILETANAQFQYDAWAISQKLESRWAAWSIALEKLNVLSESIAALETLGQRATLLVEAGEMPAPEARLLQLTLLQNQNAQRRAVSEEKRLRLELLSMMGIHPATEITLIPYLGREELPQMESIAEDALAMRHPEVIRLQSAYESAEKALQLEIRKQYPDLRLSPSIEDEEEESTIALGMGLPLAVWNRNREGIAVALAARTKAKNELEIAYEAALYEILEAKLDAETAHAERDAIESEMVPLADAQLNDLKTLLDLGESNILLLHQGVDDALDTKMAWLDARLAEAEASAKLWAYMDAFALEDDGTNKEVNNE